MSHFEEFKKQDEGCLELARNICKSHNISPDLTRMTGGSQLVFASGETYIIKIFSPEYEEDFFRTEALFLERLSGRLPITTPVLHAVGYWEKYPYIIMGKIRGTLLEQVWETLSERDQRDIVIRLGGVVRALHELPVSLFDGAPFQWPSIIDGQQERLLENHRGFGLRKELLSQLRGYTGSVSLDLHETGKMVPLHTELMSDHIFVLKEGERWRVSGLIDFEPSMVGHREYEFASV
ncbi:MAG: phosphotransferase, partial [bacterium]|nr:phosphotransferase [bacterium]